MTNIKKSNNLQNFIVESLVEALITCLDINECTFQRSSAKVFFTLCDRAASLQISL
jgi:hypothetical protein